MEIPYNGKIKIDKKQIKKLVTWNKRWLSMNGFSKFVSIKTEDLGTSLNITLVPYDSSDESDDEDEE